MLQFIVNPDLKQEHKEKLKSFMNNHKEINELKIGNLNQIKIILNESGFSGLPGGDRNGSFYDIGKCGYWWSSTEDATHSAWNRYLDSRDGNVHTYNNDKDGGLSVRCIKE